MIFAIVAFMVFVILLASFVLLLAAMAVGGLMASMATMVTGRRTFIERARQMWTQRNAENPISRRDMLLMSVADHRSPPKANEARSTAREDDWGKAADWISAASHVK